MAIPGKNSFLLFHDQRPLIDALTDRQAGELFKMIFEYSETDTVINNGDPVVNIAFISFKSGMDRASEKYQKVIIRNRENGKKGGRPKNPVG